jgi:hypothetical protein
VLGDDGLASLQTDTLHQQFFINREFSAIAKRYRVVFNANTSLAILLNSFQVEVKRLQSERGSLSFDDYEKHHTGQTPSLRLIERVTGLRWDGLLRLVYIVDGKPMKKFAKLQYVDRRRIHRNPRTGQLELTTRRERIKATLRPAPVIVEETSIEELLQAFVAELERLHLTGEPRLVDYTHDRSVTAPSYNVLRRRTGLGWDELLNRVNVESVTQRRLRQTRAKIDERREKARAAREEQRDKVRVAREEQQAQARATKIEAMAQERERFLDDVSDLVHSTSSYRLAEFKEASGHQWRQYLR